MPPQISILYWVLVALAAYAWTVYAPALSEVHPLFLILGFVVLQILIGSTLLRVLKPRKSQIVSK